jgi:L-alanine-DL-glutamate epimerase-like enolase superfamily enzyme
MTLPTFAIRKHGAFCCRYPLSTRVVTTFGRLLDRPAVFVRVEDDDGLAGGDGLLQVNATDNPMRDRFCGPIVNIGNGRMTLGDDSGLGIEPDLSSIENYRTA